MSPLRLVGLRLDGKADAVAAVGDVLGEELYGLAVAVEGGSYVLGGVGLRALPAAPEDKGARPSSAARLRLRITLRMA